MSPCCEKEAQPLLRLVTEPMVIRNDIVRAVRMNAELHGFPVAVGGVYSKPVEILRTSRNWSLL